MKPGPSAAWESVATLNADTAPTVSRLKGSLTFLAARMNFCLGVSARGVAESRKRANVGMSGWQLMRVSAGLDESGRHCERTPNKLGRAAGATGIKPGAGGLTGGNPGRPFVLCPWPMTPSTDRLLGRGEGSSRGTETDGCGASGNFSGGVCCCPKSSGRPSRMAANRKAPLRTLLVIFNCCDAENPTLDYSRRSFCRIGTLRTMLGRNSRTRLPPASVAIDVAKVRPTTLAVTLGSG